MRPADEYDNGRFLKELLKEKDCLEKLLAKLGQKIAKLDQQLRKDNEAEQRDWERSQARIERAHKTIERCGPIIAGYFSASRSVFAKGCSKAMEARDRARAKISEGDVGNTRRSAKREERRQKFYDLTREYSRVQIDLDKVVGQIESVNQGVLVAEAKNQQLYQNLRRLSQMLPNLLRGPSPQDIFEQSENLQKFDPAKRKFHFEPAPTETEYTGKVVPQSWLEWFWGNRRYEEEIAIAKSTFSVNYKEWEYKRAQALRTFQIQAQVIHEIEEKKRLTAVREANEKFRKKLALAKQGNSFALKEILSDIGRLGKWGIHFDVAEVEYLDDFKMLLIKISPRIQDMIPEFSSIFYSCKTGTLKGVIMPKEEQFGIYFQTIKELFVGFAIVIMKFLTPQNVEEIRLTDPKVRLNSFWGRITRKDVISLNSDPTIIRARLAAFFSMRGSL